MAVTQHRCLLQLPFYDIDDTEFLTLNSSELLHECDLNGTCLSYQPYRYADYNECDLNGTCLSYQPYRYADYNECDAMHDVDPVNNHYNYIFPNCKYYSCQDFTASFGNYMKNGLTFIHFNARSLNSNFKYISNFLTELNITFDLITISETWSNTRTVDDYDLKGYDVCHNVRNNKKGGGVAYYVNKELASKYIHHKSIVVDNLLECITIEIMISGHKNVIVSCLYRTPSSNTNNFSEILYDLYSELSVSKTIFICGDFNLDILKHNFDHAAKHFLDTMYSLGLYPLIDRPSRITDQSSTLIDNIFTNAKEYNNVSGLLVNDITDHCPFLHFVIILT